MRWRWSGMRLSQACLQGVLEPVCERASVVCFPISGAAGGNACSAGLKSRATGVKPAEAGFEGASSKGSGLTERSNVVGS